jgi:hypothetical protein
LQREGCKQLTRPLPSLTPLPPQPAAAAQPPKKRSKKENQFDSDGVEIRNYLLPYAYYIKMNCRNGKTIAECGADWKALSKDEVEMWGYRCLSFNKEDGRVQLPKKGDSKKAAAAAAAQTEEKKEEGNESDDEYI